MISQIVREELLQFVPKDNLSFQATMNDYTTFRVGGEVDCLVELDAGCDLPALLRYLQRIEMRYFIIGRGSNLLVSDAGYEGVILHMGHGMSKIYTQGTTLVAQAGASLHELAAFAYQAGLTGLEFASGIPGSVGGGVVMNAGAYGSQMSDVVTQVHVLDHDGNKLVLDAETMEFGYRDSVIKHYPLIVTQVNVCLQQGEPAKIKQKMDELALARRTKQPLEYPSAGSTFQRPKGHYAGELIMNAGLAGFRIGQACVSEKHCGFVINLGEAKAQDIYDLIQEVIVRVKEHANVSLEPEVIFLGAFDTPTSFKRTPK
jgi:UDP-N-acetylmuramate dehydrogenase